VIYTKVKSKLKKRVINVSRSFGYDLVRIYPDDIPLYIKLYGEKCVDKRLLYNISAGGHFDFGCGIHHPCWTNIDLDRPWKDVRYNCRGIEYNRETDIAHDFLTYEPLPVCSDLAELVHSRNSIEHLPDNAVQIMFKEIFRILKPGGIFRVGAPDIDLLYNVFSRNDRDFFGWFGHDVSIEQAFLTHFAAHASTLHHDPEWILEKISDEELRRIFKEVEFESALNYCISKFNINIYKKERMCLAALDTHINWWNRSKLVSFLSDAGFKIINESAPQQSQSPVMRNPYYFDNYALYSMFFMEAVKR